VRKRIKLLLSSYPKHDRNNRMKRYSIGSLIVVDLRLINTPCTYLHEPISTTELVCAHLPSVNRSLLTQILLRKNKIPWDKKRKS
jgi:hypothetical protein